TEGGILSLGVHDLSLVNYVTGNNKWEVTSVQGSKHEAHICLISESKIISSEIYLSSLSPLRLRHTTFSSKIKIYSIVPDNWNRLDLLKKELLYFFQCVKENRAPLLNNIESTVAVMNTLFDIQDALERKN
ncbi:MAG: hypothetical protein KAS32_14770, partial [Candidatus Peribacteraceae bacterium]|nr:hypothetical protein [Candidatus Peribacteraceae bacterium]